MALVPHKITSLAESDDDGTDGKNIIAGAVVSLFDTDGSAVTLFDSEAGANGSTAKQTDATGQVVVWVTAGEYDEEVNGSVRRRVSVGGNSVVSYPTTESLQSSRPNKTGQRAENRGRGLAQYELAESGYTALAGDITAANGRVWALVVSGELNALWFGVKSGEDVTSELQGACERAQGKSLFIPSGTYTISSTINASCNIIGESVQDVDPPYTDEGTTFQTTTAVSMFEFERGYKIEGVNFYYPDQVATLSTPIVYPPTIKTKSGQNSIGFRVVDCRFINAYECIAIGDTTGSQSSGRAIIDGVYAYAVKTFLTTYSILDKIQMSNCFVSPGVFNAANENIAEWTQVNGLVIAGEGSKLETIDITDCIFYGYNQGVANGSLDEISLCKISGTLFDAVINPVQISGTTRATNIKISNSQFLSQDRFDVGDAEAQIRFTGTGGGDGFVDISDCTFQAARNRSILVDGSGFKSVTVKGCRFRDWAAKSDRTGAIECIAVNDADVNIDVSNCEFYNFYETGLAVGLSQAGDVKVNNNHFEACWRAVNAANSTVDSLIFGLNKTTGTISGNSVVATIAAVTDFADGVNILDKPILRA